MTDLQAAAQRLRAYLDAVDSPNLAAEFAYGPEFTAANGCPAGTYALDRADLEVVLDDLDIADRAIENGNTETDKAYSQLRLANAKLAEAQAERDRLQQEVQRQIDAKMGVAGDWGNALADKAVAEQAIARVRALHQPYPSLASHTDRRTCAHCNGLTGYAVPWPCDTIQALDGEQT